MQGTNTHIFVLDYRSFFEELLFVCINCMLFILHLTIYNMLNMYTNYTSPRSLVEEIKIWGHMTLLCCEEFYMCRVVGLEERKIKLHIKYGKSYH